MDSENILMESAKGFEAVAQRMANAEARFMNILVERAGISRADAFKAMLTMLRLKVAKMDAVNGEIRVKHGAYLDAEPIRRAAGFRCDCHNGYQSSNCMVHRSA